MQKRHVNHRELYAEDEERMCLDVGYLEYVKQQGMRISAAAREIFKTFPTDRSLGSITERLRNHLWWDTQEGNRYGINNWGKAFWKTQKTDEEFARLEELVKANESARRTRG